MLHAIKSNQMVGAKAMKPSGKGVRSESRSSCQRTVIMAYEKGPKLLKYVGWPRSRLG